MQCRAQPVILYMKSSNVDMYSVLTHATPLVAVALAMWVVCEALLPKLLPVGQSSAYNRLDKSKLEGGHLTKTLGMF